MNEHQHNLEIIDFTDEYKDAIKVLNYEWLKKFFKVEAGDVISLSNPKQEIMDKGGHIFYSKMGADIVGTAALLKKDQGLYELAKMAVSNKAQGYGIGTLLLEHALKFAKVQSANKLILYSNTKLETAIRMYRKYGFVEVEWSKDCTSERI